MQAVDFLLSGLMQYVKWIYVISEFREIGFMLEVKAPKTVQYYAFLSN